VELESIDVRDWGWTGTLPGFGPLDGKIGWEEVQGPWSVVINHETGPSGTFRDGTAVMALDRVSRWPLMPFIGTLVTAPERGSENSLVGQGPWGGNIDCRELSAGNKIHMNASHKGGLLFMGDVHGSQGDSELTGLADETAAHITLSCSVIKKKQVPGVCRVEKPESLVQVESARNAGSPERAVNNAFLFMIDWLVSDFGMSKQEAYLHMSANSGVRAHIYQAVAGFFVCGVEFPKSSL
jgi:acetamidase/formamidase